jgi:hypothetical protein
MLRRPILWYVWIAHNVTVVSAGLCWCLLVLLVLPSLDWGSGSMVWKRTTECFEGLMGGAVLVWKSETLVGHTLGIVDILTNRRPFVFQELTTSMGETSFE